MAIRKNKKRIDPRYFLHETTYRDLDEEGRSEHDAEARGMARSYEEGHAAGKAGDPPRLKGGEYMRGYNKGKDEGKEDLEEALNETTDEDEIEEERFTGGSIDIDPLSDEEQDASTDAYYELYDHLMNSNLPGDKPSEQLKYALRWIAKFEQEGPEEDVPPEKVVDLRGKGPPDIGRLRRQLKHGWKDWRK